ncbi:MAG: HEAT repeat domain-containing protein [Caldilineaceae bacterium]
MKHLYAAAAATLGSYVLAGELDELDSAFAMRTEEALLAVLQNPDEALLVQCRALESIAYSGETGIRQLIEDAYYSPEEELRISALVAMGRSADTRWRGLVRAELQNPSPQMRVEAARACGELEVQKAEPELIELLADEEQLVRLSAIFALGRLGGRRAQDALRIIANGDDGIDAEAADLALEEVLFYGDSEVTPSWMIAMKRTPGILIHGIRSMISTMTSLVCMKITKPLSKLLTSETEHISNSTEAVSQ